MRHFGPVKDLITLPDQFYVKTVSEFQKILDEKLGGIEAPVPKSQEFQKISKETPEYFFGTDFFKVQIFPKSTYKASEKTAVPPEIKIEVKPLSQTPPPRVKRSLTFDQTRAAKFFTSLGEVIDGYSTIDEIKSSYRRLAKKLHPDAGASAKDAEKFKQLSLAYKLLTKNA